MKKILILLAALCAVAFAQQKGSFKDSRNGKTYKTVKIGTQTWFAENLDYSDKSYADSDSKCYGNKPENCKKYGRIYNWETAMEACPNGWHLPTREEWDALADFAGGGEIADKKLKSKSGWINNGNGTDNYGFSALPGGRGSPGGDFAFIETGSRWWSASGNYRRMNSVFDNVPWRGSYSYYLFGVRCVQGETTAESKAIIAEIQARKKAMAEAEAQAKAEAEAKAKAEAEEKARLEAAIKANSGTFTDSRDKRTYKTIKIGSQTWLAENLNFDAKDSKCYKDNNFPNETINCSKSGRLYNWETAKNACPAGWHLPRDAEWAELTGVVGGEHAAGTALRAKSGWSKDGGEDKFGFAALPGGSSYSSTSFLDYSDFAKFWSLTEDGSIKAWYRRLYSNSAGIVRDSEKKDNMLSIRCVQGDAGVAAKAEADAKAKEEAAEKEEAKKADAAIKANSGAITDSRDKKKYKTIKIGALTWMAENLDYNAKDSKCYDDKPDNCKKYGRLYDWKTAMRTCPAGWHLPTGAEWSELEKFVGGEKIAGAMLKSRSGWNEDGNGKDKVGFAALPGGYNSSSLLNVKGELRIYVSFSDYGKGAYFWSARESATSGYNIILLSGKESVSWESGGSKQYSVRCVQGEAGAEAKASIAKIEAEEKEAAKRAAEKPAAQQPQQQPSQQPANENCSVTFPKKACVSVPKNSCKLMGGKVVDKCP
jgi:uncharacterized protein (TIGR02145 family)